MNAFQAILPWPTNAASFKSEGADQVITTEINSSKPRFKSPTIHSDLHSPISTTDPAFRGTTVIIGSD